jgi:ubiquinone/menaquinone biosynthesis C-methylase UbiE
LLIAELFKFCHAVLPDCSHFAMRYMPDSNIKDIDPPFSLLTTTAAMRTSLSVLGFCLVLNGGAHAFQSPQCSRSVTALSSTVSSKERTSGKEELLALLGAKGRLDPVLADPLTKEPIQISFKGPLLGERRSGLDIRSSTNRYAGSTNTYLNLLTPMRDESASTSQESTSLQQLLTRQLTPFIPPPLRSVLALTGYDSEYVPMRDLFTSPTVSYAYERGWRQGFGQAGFPGADREFEMAKEYFAPSLAEGSVVVDMSCATGLFTRRFAAEDMYDRVLGCDYSESMLMEARRRIEAESKLRDLQKTKLELVRLDVGQIPMLDESVNVLHAGAAMHCWPDLDAGIAEIYRVLKPGGRYFATTFLSSYFSNLQIADGGSDPSQMAFQYFTSTDKLRDLLERNGFEPEKVSVEVLGVACVVIRCEK